MFFDTGEIWKDVPDYEGFYKVSSLGRVKSVPRCVKSRSGRVKHIKTVLKIGTEDERGYIQISLYKENRQQIFMLHRLVASAFIPNPENKSQVNHKNGDKGDNRVENLEWVTPSENIQHSVENGLYSIDAAKLRRMAKASVISRQNPIVPVDTGVKDEVSASKHYPTPVKCVTTGQIFSSREQAARELGISISSVYDSLRDGRPHVGYTFINVKE